MLKVRDVAGGRQSERNPGRGREKSKNDREGERGGALEVILETSASFSTIRTLRESRSQTPMLPRPASSGAHQGWDQLGKEGKCHRRVKIIADCKLPPSGDPSLRKPKDPLPPPRPLQRSPSTPGLREDGALVAGPEGGMFGSQLCDLG